MIALIIAKLAIGPMGASEQSLLSLCLLAIACIAFVSISLCLLSSQLIYFYPFAVSESDLSLSLGCHVRGDSPLAPLH